MTTYESEEGTKDIIAQSQPCPFPLLPRPDVLMTQKLKIFACNLITLRKATACSQLKIWPNLLTFMSLKPKYGSCCLQKKVDYHHQNTSGLFHQDISNTKKGLIRGRCHWATNQNTSFPALAPPMWGLPCKVNMIITIYRIWVRFWQ